MTEKPTPEQSVQRAMEILNEGASSPVERAVVQKEFVRVQEIKRGPRGNYSASLRYGYEPTLKQRDAAKKAAVGLKRILAILGPVARFPLSLTEYDLAWLENMQRDLQIIGDIKLHGSRFDDRPLCTIPVVVGLLKAAGKEWETTRDKDADQLAAALWGEPDKSFQEHLLRYSHLPAVSRERAEKMGAVPALP
jgi:hypothetical protein